MYLPGHADADLNGNIVLCWMRDIDGEYAASLVGKFPVREQHKALGGNVADVTNFFISDEIVNLGEGDIDFSWNTFNHVYV